VLYAKIYNSLVSGYSRHSKPRVAHLLGAASLSALTSINIMAVIALANERNIDWATTAFSYLTNKRNAAAVAMLVFGVHLLLSKFYQWRSAQGSNGIQGQRVSAGLGNMYWMFSILFVLWVSKSLD
jgi:hypothetical protein